MITNNINLNNSYKLITNEDSLHIHKIIGSIIIINYTYRYLYYILYGHMNIKTNFDIYIIFLHGLLSVSSLIFHIPKIRNINQPMIYPEYRMHSIIFALRSVFSCIIYFYNYNYKNIIVICGLTFILADIISAYYNTKNQNNKTMRNMPFDKSFTIKNQQALTLMYSYSQIGATLFMFGNINTAFSPMFAIQIAALFMTLVRKSIINTYIWHLIYSLSLWINYILLTSITPGCFILFQIIFNIHYYIIFPYKINKYIAWFFYFLFIINYKELNYEKNINNFILDKYNIEYFYFIRFFILFIYIILFYQYGILYITNNKKYLIDI